MTWQTAFEVGVLSFDLYRSESSGGAQWIKVNAEIIPADNALSGASYQTFDSRAEAGKISTYKLIAFDQQNVSHELGIFPVCPTKQPAEVAVTADNVADQTPLHILTKSGSLPKTGNIAVSELNETLFVKVTTTNSGLQIVSAETLAALLEEPLATVQNAIAERAFQLSHRGQLVGYLAGQNGSALLFYAPAYKDNYTDRNVFWLTSGSADLLATRDGQAPAANTNATYYNATLHQERDALVVTTLPLGVEEDFWMWNRLVAGLSLNDTATYPLALDQVASSAGTEAQLSFRFWGANTVAHRVQVSVNGQILTNADWQFIAPLDLNVNFSSTLLTNGNNSIRVKALVNGSTSPRSQWYVDRFSLVYPRQFLARAGMIEFTTDGNQVVTVDGFANDALTVLDVSNPLAPVRIENLTVESASTNFRVSFVPGATVGRYLAFQSGAGMPVQSASIAMTVNLSSSTNAGDYIVIAPEFLLPAATNLANYRLQTGLKPLIANLQLIYNEFGHGFVTPHAIHRFLATAFTNWTVPPKYVVLLGDGTYDYRNLLGHGDNLTPPLLVSTLYGLFASDSAFGDVTGDGLPDLAVGRLSGNSLDDVNQLIDKIIAYEAAGIPAGPARSLLIADAPDAAGDFNTNVDLLAHVLSNKFSNTILRRTEQPDAATMTAAVTNSWNAGNVDLVNYAGHGAVDRFGSSGYLTSANLTNLHTSRNPVTIAITCVAGQFSVPGTDCLGENLLRKNPGGAIAVIAPTGLSWDSEAMELNLRLAKLLKENTLSSLGEIFRQAMADHIREDVPQMVTWIYNFLGDPAIRYQVLSDPRIASISVGNQALHINWSGGRPPFRLEKRLNLQSPWLPFETAITTTNVVIPTDGTTGFFRIVSGD